MTNPILFIKTPRAGRHNQRFIAPDDYNGGDRILSQWAYCTRQQSEGANYLSVGKEVKQQESGRTGTEQLILAGVDTSKLSSKQFENVRNFLTEHLPMVESLVIKDIDWDKVYNTMVLRHELTQWLQELELLVGNALPALPLPVLEIPVEQFKPKPEVSAVNGQVPLFGVLSVVVTQVPLFGVLSVVVAVVAGLALITCSSNHEDVAKNSTAEMERLVEAIGGDTAKVRKEITLRGIPVSVQPPPHAGTKNQSLTGELDKKPTKSEGGAERLRIPNIPIARKPWPLSMFVSIADNTEGRDFAGILSDKPLNDLHIAHSPGSLQRLVQCRNAIRTLMGVAGEVYTPFFERGDFGDNKEPTALIAKIYNWQSDDGTVNGKGDYDCSIEPKLSGIMQWVTTCLATKYDGEYKNDANLKRIKQFDMDCKAVVFTPKTM